MMTRPDILRVDNCSEVDVAGNFYKQDGKYYDDCCDLENANDSECVESLVGWIIFGILVGVFLILPCLYWIICLFCDGVKTCCKKCYNACCKPQSIVSNENNATRQAPRPITTRPSTLPIPSPTRTPTAPPESLVDRLPRSKASVNQCTGPNNSCSICMAEYELDSDLITLPCLHIFHYECTKQWLRRKNECPVCRTRVD